MQARDIAELLPLAPICFADVLRTQALRILVNLALHPPAVLQMQLRSARALETYQRNELLQGRVQPRDSRYTIG